MQGQVSNKGKQLGNRIIRTYLFGVLPISILFVLGQAVHADETGAAAEKMAEQMLTAIGGRQAWAELKNTINGSQQNRADEPTDVYAVITMDFENPRFRIETTAQGLHLIRVINGDKHWRLRRSGEVEDVPPGLLEEDGKWYAAHLYRTIHRIAARDRDISVRISEKQRLEVYGYNERLLWFELDAKGEPYAFGSWDDDVGSLTGPWDFVQDGIHHPRWVSSADAKLSTGCC